MAQELRRASESKFGMIADEQGAIASLGSREFSGNHGARPRTQSSREMLLIFDKNKIVGTSGFQAGHSADFYLAITDQAGSDPVRNLLQRALHGFTV